jgi:hypothetical protein
MIVQAGAAGAEVAPGPTSPKMTTQQRKTVLTLRPRRFSPSRLKRMTQLPIQFLSN